MFAIAVISFIVRNDAVTNFRILFNYYNGNPTVKCS